MPNPPMSMNKTIHCAVRRDLDRFRRALDAFTDGDRERAAELHRAWVNFDAQLPEPPGGEQECTCPALRAIGVTDANIESFDSEHAAMAAALATTRDAMDKLRSTASPADPDAPGAAVA